MIEMAAWALVTALLAVGITTWTYHKIAFRKLEELKPKFTFFPKYQQEFEIPIDEVRERIKEAGFAARGNSDREYERGKVYGDFSAKAMKLRIIINVEKHSIKLFAPYMGILFDNGDLWKIVNEITIDEEP